MLKDALKWLLLAEEVQRFVAPLLRAFMETQDIEVPDWFDDLTDIVGKAVSNAQAGVAFDEALAARIRARIETLPEEPTQEDFLALAESIRESYGDFKSVMAARRAAIA